ncbi:MAG: aldo/keto reductase [Gammaproteobacteria bacterium]|nr:aldo/keto reductase [Gammaproteobacteria bacterium]
MQRPYDQQRRRLLKILGGLGLGITTPLSSDTLSAVAHITKAIPATDERLPIIGLGTSRVFNVGRDVADLSRLREVVRILASLENSMVDTSPMYGEAERVTGDLVENLAVRKRLFLATKVWTEGKQAGIKQMQESQRLLKSQTIDLMQIHNLVDWQTHIKTLRDWKAQGLIRYLGITHYTEGAHAAVIRVMRQTPLDFLQINYSLAETEAANQVLPLAREKGIAVIANRPFARGALFRAIRGRTLPAWTKEIDCESWAQFFLKFVVSHPAITCAIPGTSKANHMLDNQGAAKGRLPNPAMRERMLKLIATL